MECEERRRGYINPSNLGKVVSLHSVWMLGIKIVGSNFLCSLVWVCLNSKTSCVMGNGKALCGCSSRMADLDT